MAQETLLPDNRTAFEEAADLTGSRASELRDGLRDLVKPYAIPATHLPWLAWGLSVDLWKQNWPEDQKRAQTARSLPFHAIKGTQTAIAQALAVMGAEARRFVVPPATTYMTRALTEEDRTAYLDRFAQLRVYPFVARGITGRFGLFLSCKRGLGTTGLGPVNPVSLKGTRYIRTATLYDRGVETSLTFRSVTPERVGSANAMAFDEVILGPKPTAAIHLDATPKARAFLIDDQSVRRRVLRIPRDASYSYRLGREQYTTVLPEGELIDVRPQSIAEAHPAQATSVFPSATGQRVLGGHLPETIAWRYLYSRWHIHDPDRVPDTQWRSTHLGHTRLGMPAYHAEVLTRIKGRRHPRTAGAFVNGYMVAAIREPIADAREAVMVSKSLRDKVLINSKTYRLPRAGDRRALGALKIGTFIEV
ncbi:phage tail protein, P2 protein I family [Thalassovita litoralis]|uniref:Phage tail protein, P2 protein I family n=1 Tax=Thalassovita litoralis TaxID=1010611 RepID=A0A521D0P7_9RHOB|nr:phage tail protein I [Thalassovita litoralis]SMO65266.1 phage tail protein, P2 protein I family [Thalassovita litoralis]